MAGISVVTVYSDDKHDDFGMPETWIVYGIGTKAGSDAASLAMTAEDKGDHYILQGQKTLISNGGIADFYTIFARTGEAPGAKGITAFIVDANSKGFEVAERMKVIAPHPLARLKFNNVKVDKAQVLGNPQAVH